MQLEIRNLKKRYGKQWALNGLTITFNPGVYGILGSNGAGKSTMMNLLTDNLKRDGGEILLDGKDILKLGRDYRKRLGYMPQQQGFYEQMTADTFLFYMARLKGLKRKQAEAEIDRLLQVTGLAGERHKKLGGYSGGMRQRVLLAQAMLGNPGILILDEPTAGLDPKERIRIRNFISSLSRDRIILLATHIVSDIVSISDRIIMMKKGKLIGTGTSGELMRRVADKVREMPCEPEELPAMQQKYRVGNVFQRDGKTWIRMVGDELPQEGSFVTDHLSLEDVYLYYLGE